MSDQACNRARSHKVFRAALFTSAMAVAMPSALHAQDAQVTSEEPQDEIVVSGIRASLATALNEKRNSESLVEVIQAEDIGKLPDQNLAEVLENITGVQITRSAGIGTGVQIRGSNDNRVEINGVGTVGAGTGRGGINFEDINAAIIGSVEVIKAPLADTIEGSVGGTINLRTIRPLAIDERIATVRVQGEYSEFTDSLSPRIAASFGDNWALGDGEIGIVLAGSYTEQRAISFRPRVDRDNVVPAGAAVTAAGAPGPDFPFLGIQFLNQALEDFEFETINLAGSIEWSPNPGLTFFVDGFYNDQRRDARSARIQGSGVGGTNIIRANVPDAFETINYGSLDGVDLGSIQAALVGTIQPNLARDPDDPNLRFSSDTSSRLTENHLIRMGGSWEGERLRVSAEFSTTGSDTASPNFSTTLNFINPNPLVQGFGTSNDNAVPFAYDLSGGALAFGIDFSSPFAPTVADLLDPANVVLDAISVGENTTENSEDAFRIDLSYDTTDFLSFLDSVDIGYRYSNRSSTFTDVGSNIGLSQLADSPFGTAFSELLVPGPNNFNAADGRQLFFANYLIVDPDRAINDPDGTLDILQAALLGAPGMRSFADPTGNDNAFFDIEEETHAFYGQANLDFGPVRANVGFRYIDTSIDSTGNTVTAGVVEQVVSSGGYSQFLPRINVVAELADDLLLRASYTEDINRPGFNQLSTSFTFPTNSNAPVQFGNPNLAPETVESYDASLEWYFAPSAIFSVGVFHKIRTNLFVAQLEDVAVDGNGFRDITPPCEGGGIFNPIANRNVNSDQPGQGICVPILSTVNDTGNTTQTGIEVAFQYDLSAFEDTLGFASGFGVIANYTYQDFGGGELTNGSSTRGQQIFEAINPAIGPVEAVQGLLDFSQNAYNITLFYEKYGLSARARYTWREAFRTLDTAGGATLNSTLGFPVVTESRGQLNASITYDVTDWFNIGVEGVNLTKSQITQSCVNSGAQFCFEGLPDRRITFGATVRF